MALIQDALQFARSAYDKVKGKALSVNLQPSTTPRLNQVKQQVASFFNKYQVPQEATYTMPQVKSFAADFLNKYSQPIQAKGIGAGPYSTERAISSIKQAGSDIKSLFTRAPGTYSSLDPGSYFGGQMQYRKELQNPNLTQKQKQNIMLEMNMQPILGITGGSSKIKGKTPSQVAKFFENKPITLRTTQGLGQDVLRLGYSADDVSRMTPPQAQKILSEGARAERLKAVPENFNKPEFLSEVSKAQRFIDSDTKTPVGRKINILDAWKTPENVLKKIGWDNEAKLLRSKWDAYQAQLPKEINKVTQWSKRVDPSANQSIFKYLDGQKVTLQPEELKVANEIKAYLADWADKLKLPKEKRISNYITRLWERGKEGVEFDEDIAKLIRDKVPGSTYDPFLTKRTGMTGYREDVWAALDSYIKRGVRKYNMDQALEVISKKSDSLESSQYDYIKEYISDVQMRPKKIDILIDNTIKQSPVGYRLTSRPTAFVTQKARSAVFKGAIGLNPMSAVRNLTQVSNTIAELGFRDTLRGYINLIKNGSKELNDQGILSDGFIQDRNLSYFKGLSQKAGDAMFWMFNKAELANRGGAYFAAKAKYLDQGLSETQAILKAKETVRKTQFSFGRLDVPLALQGDINKTLWQFSTYPVKQLEFLGGKIKQKEWASLVRYVAATLILNKTLEEALGMKSDIWTLLPIPGLGPVARGTIGLAQYGYGKLKNEDEIAAEGKRNIGRTAATLIPAGVQGLRSLTAINAMREGGSFTKSGNLRFEVKPSVLTAVFGVWSTPEAQDYMNKLKGFGLSKEEKAAQKFTKSETKLDTEAEKVSLKIYQKLNTLDTEAERLEYLESLDKTGILTKQVKRNIVSFQKQEQRKSWGDFSKAVYKIQSNEDAARFILDYFDSENKTEEERIELLNQLKRDKILTKDLRKKLVKEKKRRQTTAL